MPIDALICSYLPSFSYAAHSGEIGHRFRLMAAS